jgi:ABC-type Fe3+ transport system substrate-binding protein
VAKLRTFLEFGLCIVLLAGLLPSANNCAAAQAEQFQQLLDAARKEIGRGPFVVWSTNPREEKTHQALFDAFRKKYALPNLKFEWLPLHPNNAVARTIAESRAGKAGAGVIFGGVIAIMDLEREGLLESFDWIGTFKSVYPGIQEPALERVPVELRGKWLALLDGTRSYIFNTQQIKSAEIPDNVDGLAEPKWSRKFVMNIGGSSPWDLFVLTWGEERTLNVLKKLLANRPIFKTGTPAVNNAIAAGEAPIGLGSIHDTERLKAKGASVEWKTYGEYIPILPQGFSVPKKSPQPNLGRLFSAWMAMEGTAITERMEFIGRLTLAGSVLNKLVKERAPKAKLLFPTTEKEFRHAEAFGEKVTEIIAAASRTK